MKKDFNQNVRLNSKIFANLDAKLGHLNIHQHLMIYHPQFFLDVPKQTIAVCHYVIVNDALPIKQQPYPLNPQKIQYLRTEVQCMLLKDNTEPRKSDGN